MIETLKLDKDVARELAYGLSGEWHEGYEVIENQIVDTTRWSTVYFLVIKKIGELGYWGTHYDKGSTEYQDHRPFEDEDGIFYQVRPETVHTIKWVKAD
jgi:hypothetical protein